MLPVSGKLWMRSLVMRDLGTKTEWSHLLGRGMKRLLEGKKSRPLVWEMVVWEARLRDHPKTTVLNMPSRPHGCSSKFHDAFDRFVYGFEIRSKAWAIPYSGLQNNHVLNFIIDDQAYLAKFDEKGATPRLFSANLDGRPLRFQGMESGRMIDTETGSTWSITSDTAVEGPLGGKSGREVTPSESWDEVFV